MNRIAVYGYPGKVWFDSFAEIVAELTSEKNSFKMYGTGPVGNYLYVYIGGIIQYNVMFRDYLRTNGADALIELLCEMAPAFRNETEAIASLKKKMLEWGPLGNYDIQCLSVDDEFSVLGHEFKGLDEVRRSVEIYQRSERYCFKTNNYIILNGIHIACNYEPYPTFDSFDSADDREYCNYFFLSCCFDKSDLKMIDSMKTYGNNNKVSEHMKCIAEMPVLYYEGDGPSMLLVTPRQS